MFSEFAKADHEKKALLRAEIRRLIDRLKKRNHLNTSAVVRTTISSAVQAIGEQIKMGEQQEAEIASDTDAESEEPLDRD